MQLQYFDIKEFDCQETGNNEMNPFFLEKLDELRHRCGFPFKITSGYRDPSHSIEQRKVKPGTHARGIAADIHINSGSEGHPCGHSLQHPCHLDLLAVAPSLLCCALGLC
jgi:uncharacterized protein YcbK (DUF882 family)